MFQKVIIEKDILHHPKTKEILKKINYKNVVETDSYRDIFEKVKKPYLQKRDNLNLIIAIKKGELVKEAPDAYGLGKEKHFYFIHAYNCIYECEYCYLQGYFNSPDLVLFINHDDIINQIQEKIKLFSDAWFHAGEFSDSLALSHITGEISEYHELFKQNPEAKLELRTKSANIKVLRSLAPLKNLFVTYSLSPKDIAKSIDHKAAPMNSRLEAIRKLHKMGHQIGIHFDPIIYTTDWEQKYVELIENIHANIPIDQVQFFSLGVVRFTKDVFQEFKNNYPNSKIHMATFVSSFDDKIRYPKPLRLNILRGVKELLIHYGADEKNIYLCME